MIDQTQIDTDNETMGASSQDSCFACGKDNPHGLHLEFETSATGESTANWVPAALTEGFRGIVHGGIVSTVLDEAMSKSVAAAGFAAFTAEIHVRFREHVVSECPVQVRGWIDTKAKRLIKTEASITDSQGKELAHAWASFLTAK